MTEIYKDLYQFTEVLEPIKLSIHQYLLLSEESVLIQTGTVLHAKNTIPKLKEVLGNQQLKYILVSHFESDECGGIALILKEYPQAIVVCSETTARQLMGFGFATPNQIEIKKPGENLEGATFEFETISYPSEMHMWEGLLFFERKRNIFFSSDLMFGMGETHGQITKDSWHSAIKSSGADTLPNKTLQQKLIEDLQELNPIFIASGHGACIEIAD